MPRYERDWDRRLNYCFLHSKSSALDVRTSAELDPDGIPTVAWRCDHFVARLPTDFWPPRIAALWARLVDDLDWGAEVDVVEEFLGHLSRHPDTAV